LTFHAPLPIGARATRRSIVTDVKVKDGRSGRLTFVTVRHDILVDGAAAVVEEQDLVFRGDGSGTPPVGAPDPRTPTERRAIAPDATALFRFSALTFNAHRIHYDRQYAVEQEHYPDLVVHGPYQAMLLADHLLRTRPERRFATFSFRGARPLFVGPAALNLAGDGPVVLWTTDRDGCACMEAEVSLA
jgi:3-methylfumaryl-CoA hydratase